MAFRQPPYDESDRRRAMALSIWTVMALMAAMVAARGASGAFTQPLPMGWLVLWIAGGHFAGGWAGRLLPASPIDSQLWSCGPIIGCVAAILLSTSLAAVLAPFQWGLLVGAALLHVGAVCEPIWLVGRESRVESREPECAAEEQSDPTLSPQLSTLNSQWMLRRDDSDGEIWEGQIRVDFAAGVRETTVHVAFCPPLATIPTVELEDVDGLGWELKTTAIYPYGLRISVRRGARETAAASGSVAYWACAPRSADLAA